jgi:hypothetical protein
MSMFEAAGFHRVTQTDAHSASLPRWLMRRTFWPVDQRSVSGRHCVATTPTGNVA